MSDTETYIDPTMTYCEQAIVCPETLRDNKISFVSKGSHVVATLVSSTPSISTVPSTTVLEIDMKTLLYNHYAYRSFNLVEGSTIHWDIEGDYYFQFTLLKGIINMNRYEDNYIYNYIKQGYTKATNFSYTVDSSDEYFIIVEARSATVTLNKIVYTVDHLRYNVEEKAVKSCTDSCDFVVNSSSIPGACVIAEMGCEFNGVSTDIKISYYGAHTTLYYVCLVLAIVGGIGLVASILACVLCAAHKSKVNGQTYDTVPSSPAAASSYPAGYQQPQPTSAYQGTPTTGYGQPTPAPTAGYSQPVNYTTPVAPAYTAVDPSYSYNPSAPAPAPAPSYGTVPPTY